jgi:quercetin dioxygenase-like cupin family protein
MSLRTLVAALVLAIPTVVRAQGTAAPAAPSALKRTILQTQTMGTQPNREAITAVAELAVGGTAPRHVHGGEEIGYLLEGVGVVEMEGAAPRMLKAGDAFYVPPNTPHLVRNTGTVVWKAVSTYLIEKGQPLATAVPKP